MSSHTVFIDTLGAHGNKQECEVPNASSRGYIAQLGFRVFSLDVFFCVSVIPYVKNLFIVRKSVRQNAPYVKLGQSPLFSGTRKNLSCGLGMCGVGNFMYTFLNLEIFRDKKML